MGNGASIRIGQDKWLTQPSTFKLTSPPIGIQLDAMVSSLIEPLFASWKTELIWQAFSNEDATQILRIPLSSRLPEDSLVWAYMTKGLFLVKSAYNEVDFSSSSCFASGISNGPNTKSFWKSLWRLNIPNMIKSFA